MDNNVNNEERSSLILQTSDENCGHSFSYLKGKDENGEDFYIVIDCGISMVKEDDDKEAVERVKKINNNLPIPDEDIDKIKAVLITHNHDDHIGLIPYLVKLGYKGPIYISEFGRMEIGVILSDCCFVSNREGWQLYDKGDVSRSLSNMKSAKYNEETEVYSDNFVSVSFVLLKNGHLPGSGSYLLMYKFSDNKRINMLFSGDIKTKNEFIEDCSYPSWIKKIPLTVMCESTYGGTFSNQVKYDDFEENVAKVYNRGGNVIIATIANERTEIILHKLYLMKQRNQIPFNTKIWVKGTLTRELFYIIRTQRDRIGVPKDYIFDFCDLVFMSNRVDTPKSKHYIMLVTPGMLKGGNSLNAAIRESSNPLSCLMLTSYIPPHGIAERFLKTPKGQIVKINKDRAIVKNFDVFQYTGISGHSKADELKNLFLDQFENKQCILINHGDPENQVKFKAYLDDEYQGKVPTYIASRKNCFRITCDGVSDVQGSHIEEIVTTNVSSSSTSSTNHCNSSISKYDDMDYLDYED